VRLPTVTTAPRHVVAGSERLSCSKVLVHRNHESLLLDSQSEYGGIRHSKVEITNSDYIQALTSQPGFYGLSNSHINEEFHFAASTV